MRAFLFLEETIMQLTDVHRDIISAAKRYYLETGTLDIKVLNFDTKDFYTHFPGGLKQLEEYIHIETKEK